MSKKRWMGKTRKEERGKRGKERKKKRRERCLLRSFKRRSWPHWRNFSKRNIRPRLESGLFSVFLETFSMAFSAAFLGVFFSLFFEVRSEIFFEREKIAFGRIPEGEEAGRTIGAFCLFLKLSPLRH